MSEEKREEMLEAIVVLDEGMDGDNMAGPLGVCCGGAVAPFRG